MGKARLNIWVRDKHCRVIKRSGRLYLDNCLGERVHSSWIRNGHAEVEIEPGCYVAGAKFCIPHWGNINTDRTVVIVRCGDEACVNLLLPRYKEDGKVAPRDLLHAGGCPARLIQALGVHGIRKNIDLEEALNVLIETAEIDRGQLAEALEDDVRDLKEHLEEIPKEEQEEAREYMKLMEKTKKIVGGKGRPR